ncbi:hypothetical protein [Actinokineospora iranica]|uniref:Uncharacterized protein n=1 Tax=Actinokineospora iranica TaxID=1271860 RepID=A0A1G6UY14_9PSEU|nr:hypothetical protein [Actinokineospora iranica]SDD45515.1 hypothetical protein SAMN05216174_111117 [Actinokineospora iranica]
MTLPARAAARRRWLSRAASLAAPLLVSAAGWYFYRDDADTALTALALLAIVELAAYLWYLRDLRRLDRD